ncbi:GNAT family N-acetyltransferase [Novosphingobium flavum]|uniref:GNAT family N-acetyltransferase n=1 Tax=Novosphingobium aerophilum TaxID=2839843 RepID=A0A7X1F6U1_9SPHN|nr:GNAT family N-acetyltransferase [Novosphingobium aerophilum]MBC2651435.1 GNAT family N-acetyltransferase [Novosphingobium aerophilum]MBC2663300.1 GNAT family N-acetyltransferase [Novosphingobium aerophilum]
MFFRSERLFLRPAWPEDWSDLFRAVSDAEICRNLAAVPWPYRPEDAQWYAGQAQDARHPHFLVTLPGSKGGETIGTVALMAGAGGRTELGYWIGRAHWGRGFATEAVRAALVLARTLGHSEIHAAHFHDNPASGRVLRKAGFLPSGRIESCFSRARGVAVPAVHHAIRLDAPNDCDGDPDPLMRAA